MMKQYLWDTDTMQLTRFDRLSNYTVLMQTRKPNYDESMDQTKRIYSFKHVSFPAISLW